MNDVADREPGEGLFTINILTWLGICVKSGNNFEVNKMNLKGKYNDLAGGLTSIIPQPTLTCILHFTNTNKTSLHQT